MAGGLGPRLLLETGFLILLAVVVGLADLRPALIILVMAIGWLLVSLIEYVASRQAMRVPAVEPFAPPPGPPVIEEEQVFEALPPARPAPPPAEEQTMTDPAAPEPTEELAPQPIERSSYKLAPLAARPPRRWLFFGPRVRRQGQEESDSGETEAPGESTHEEER
jgi:hypothetical protein